MRIAFYTLGCKVNQYETQIISQFFAREGYDIVSHDDIADIYVINSCTVTATGDKKTRQMLRHFKLQNPAAKLVLTGCFPQAFPDVAERLPEADVITGARSRGKLVEQVARCLATDERIIEIHAHEHKEEFEQMQADAFSEHTRAFIKIEDGCDRYCTYCIIPTARGPVRSKPLEDLKTELQGLSKAGYQEVVLVGINLPSYGKEIGLRLVDAIQTAATISGIRRIRLGSLEPELLTEEDIARMASMPQTCPQFHLSLQSGCDATLRRMNRHYDTAEYAAIVKRLRTYFPGCAITTDIMVGFPGETQEEFCQSLAFAEQIGFAKAHVFAYSPRPGTRAATMPDQVSKAEKEKRSAQMIALTNRTRAEYLAAQIGKEAQVLFETLLSDGCYEGYTETYVPVRMQSTDDLRGKICRVRIHSAEDGWCSAQLL